MKETMKSIARFVGTAILILTIAFGLVSLLLIATSTFRTLFEGDILLALWGLIVGVVACVLIGSVGLFVASVLLALGEPKPRW